MVQIGQQEAQAIALAGGPPELPVERVLHEAAVVEPGQRIARGLLAQRLTQADVGEGEGHLPGQRLSQALPFGQQGGALGRGRPMADLHVEQPQRLGLRGKRRAQQAACDGLLDVRAAQFGLILAHRVELAPSQGPAVGGGKGAPRRLRTAPRGHGLRVCPRGARAYSAPASPVKSASAIPPITPYASACVWQDSRRSPSCARRASSRPCCTNSSACCCSSAWAWASWAARLARAVMSMTVANTSGPRGDGTGARLISTGTPCHPGGGRSVRGRCPWDGRSGARRARPGGPRGARPGAPARGARSIGRAVRPPTSRTPLRHSGWRTRSDRDRRRR